MHTAHKKPAVPGKKISNETMVATKLVMHGRCFPLYNSKLLTNIYLRVISITDQR